ncbi:MAG TPA: diacylglycerol kinase family protein [Gemmatimonadaceae bacterium]|nr:diacylglycerol kinase family protein [Gemmatimonadaceae bacterium]
MSGKICVILNPASRGGATRSRLPEIRAALEAAGIGPIFQTTAAGEETSLAARAIATGAQTIVAVGGDGTCSRIAAAILESRIDCRLAVLPSGTGNDFAKTLGVSRCSVPELADLIENGATAQVDAGRADGRYFINSCGFGFDASVLEATTRIHRLKGYTVYIYSALRMLFGYKGFSARIGGDDAGPPSTRHLLMLTVSNGRFLGGAFMIAPGASPNDGLLDVCHVHDMSVPRRLQLFARAMRGTHAAVAGVTMKKTARLELRFDSPPLIEIDGELHRASARDVTIECVPRALSVVTAPGAIAG